MAEIVVENVGAEARQAPAPRLFGAVLERGCAGDVVPGAACALRIRRLAEGDPAALWLEEAGLQALAP